MRHLGKCGCNHDGVERRKILRPGHAVAVLGLDVVDPEFAQARAGLADQRGDALHRHHLARQFAQHGGLIAAAQPDFQHAPEFMALAVLAVAGQFGHARHDVGIGNRLPEADRQRRVFVGARLQRLIDKQMARHAAHRRQHDFVLDALLAQALDHAAARARRGHADAGAQVQGFSHAFTLSIWLKRVRSICSGVIETKPLATA